MDGRTEPHAAAYPDSAGDIELTGTGLTAHPDVVLRHLQLQIMARDGELAALERRLAEATSRIEIERDQYAYLQQSLAKRFEELGKLARFLVRAEEMRGQAERLLEEEQRQRGLFETQLRAMESSTFWRMTQPARTVVSRIKAVMRRTAPEKDMR